MAEPTDGEPVLSCPYFKAFSELRWQTEDTLPETPTAGLYRLEKDGAPIYIGQSGDIRKRIGQHKTEGKKAFDSFLWAGVATGTDRLRLEGIAILATLPPANKNVHLGFTPQGKVYDMTYLVQFAGKARKKKK